MFISPFSLSNDYYPLFFISFKNFFVFCFFHIFCLLARILDYLQLALLFSCHLSLSRLVFWLYGTPTPGPFLSTQQDIQHLFVPHKSSATLESHSHANGPLEKLCKVTRSWLIRWWYSFVRSIYYESRSMVERVNYVKLFRYQPNTRCTRRRRRIKDEKT